MFNLTNALADQMDDNPQKQILFLETVVSISKDTLRDTYRALVANAEDDDDLPSDTDNLSDDEDLGVAISRRSRDLRIQPIQGGTSPEAPIDYNLVIKAKIDVLPQIKRWAKTLLQ